MRLGLTTPTLFRRLKEREGGRSDGLLQLLKSESPLWHLHQACCSSD